MADKKGVDFGTLSSTHQRLYLRNQIAEENRKLASTAKGAGVEDRFYGKFQNRGYQDLYGGRGVDEIRVHKGLPVNAKILDHMDSTELAANLFRITQTDEKLCNDKIMGREAACDAHYEVGAKVRATMKELSGVLPENLPVAEEVKRVAAAERKHQKQRALAPPTAKPTIAGRSSGQPICIDLKADLWKYALLIMSVRPDGKVSTSDMIAEMPGYIHLTDEHATANASRFRITLKGMHFVREYFKN